MTNARDRVAAQLENMHTGGPLDSNGGLASHARHATFVEQLGAWVYTPARLRFHEELVETFLASQSEIRTEGRCAVVTAGVPGAGKSTALDGLGYTSSSWRRVDADDFKVELIKSLTTDDAYAGLLATELVDGRPVRPLELAALVHQESTLLADQARQECLRRGEDVVLEGTLSWKPLPAILVNELQAVGYSELTVVMAEPTLPQALERALDRWWKGRCSTDPLGGRFTPSGAIKQMYDSNGVSVCSINAHEMVELGRRAGMEPVLLEQTS